MHCKLLPSFISSNTGQNFTRLTSNPIFEFPEKKKKKKQQIIFCYSVWSLFKRLLWKLTSFNCSQHLHKLYFTEILNKDLIRISEWANQWKISFKLDLTKQAQWFSHKSVRKQTIQQSILILLQWHTLIAKSILECRLIKDHIFFSIFKIFFKANRGIAVIQKLSIFFQDIPLLPSYLWTT